MSGRRKRRAAPLPPLYGDLRHWGLIRADALALLAQLPPGSVDAVVTDPPYGLSFNGEHWDGGTLADGHGFQAFTSWWATEIRRVLKPGGHLAAFGAPRTFHRLVAGCEDAGLEIRDGLVWCFSGVPKSRRMAGGLGSALKPAYEPIVLARKPLDARASTIGGNVAMHGTGALNIDAARVPRVGGATEAEGYWPANLALQHELDCDERTGDCVPDCPRPLIDRMPSRSADQGPRRSPACSTPARLAASNGEAGLDLLPKRSAAIFSGSGGAPRANVHPTVKPQKLMSWLIRLVVPLGGLVLDPFAGSGSTGCAAMLEGRRFVGIERDADYVAIAQARIAHWGERAARERAS